MIETYESEEEEQQQQTSKKLDNKRWFKRI